MNGERTIKTISEILTNFLVLDQILRARLGVTLLLTALRGIGMEGIGLGAISLETTGWEGNDCCVDGCVGGAGPGCFAGIAAASFFRFDFFRFIFL